MDEDFEEAEGESGRFFDEPPLIEPGGVIASVDELKAHPTKKFRLVIDQGYGPKPAEALLVRFGDEVHAFLNVCPHVGTPLDWMPNEFFDAEGRRLLCRTHGALFDPLNGVCLGGPCAGRGLTELAIVIDGEGRLRLCAIG
jgi:nitrite reductase/ring-hydroxylating ferredoxin subunit